MLNNGLMILPPPVSISLRGVTTEVVRHLLFLPWYHNKYDNKNNNFCLHTSEKKIERLRISAM